MVLVPLCNNDGDTVPAFHAEAAEPLTFDDATVLDAIVPVGMLERITSVPFTYTTAPSSRTRPKAAAATFDASATSNVLRKYVVMYFELDDGPKLTTVASSPSP